MGLWHGYLSGAGCRFACGPADATATHYLLQQIGFIFLVLPFWYWLTQVVPDKVEGRKMVVVVAVVLYIHKISLLLSLINKIPISVYCDKTHFMMKSDLSAVMVTMS